MESALVIASQLPKDKIGRMFFRIKNKIEEEDINQQRFLHYVEALAAWDMNKLISIIELGILIFIDFNLILLILLKFQRVKILIFLFFFI